MFAPPARLERPTRFVTLLNLIYKFCEGRCLRAPPKRFQQIWKRHFFGILSIVADLRENDHCTRIE